MYPFRFQPIFRQYLWGGRRLGEVLNKELPATGVVAESWEIVDHGDDQSRVQYGDLAGRSLSELIGEFGEQLLGARVHSQIQDSRLPENLQNRFPLLFKFLDAHQTLSVQVHPNDDLAAFIEPPDLGKTEAWYVIAAEPGSRIYAGLKLGTDTEALGDAVAAGDTESVLHAFEPKPGDCIFIPAGTIHAIGAGLLIAEIQQCSDTTYRLFDWNRVDAQGVSRELHIDEAIHATDYNAGPTGPRRPQPTDDPCCEQLVRCSKFVMNRWTVESARQLPARSCFRILAVTQGAVTLEQDPAGIPLVTGGTALIPASIEAIDLVPRESAELLEIFVP